MCCPEVCGIAGWRVWNAQNRNRLAAVRWEEGMVISGAWMKLGFLRILVDSVDLWVLWMGTFVGPLRVLWHIWDPRVRRDTAAAGVGWFVLVTLGLWSTWILGSLGITMVYLALEQVKGTVVTVIPAWSVDSVNILGSRVLPVPLVSVDSVVSVVAVMSVESVVSSCLGLG